MTTRRSLLLAGGGLKVAFQAGVLQVLLDEAGLVFDHVDACSGGAFNAAMLCGGRSGTEIADAWRATRPADGIAVRARDLARFPFGRSLVTLDTYRRTIFPQWGLDWDAVHASTIAGTFNTYDITDRRHRVYAHTEMSEDLLCACVSLPVWFPAVEVDGHLHTDAVFVTDADVDGAVARGADQIWIVWTVSTRPEWFPGLLAQFFHALESAANGTLRRALDRIAENNAAIDAGGTGCYGKRIVVRELTFEVPVHYLVVLGADRLHRAVERGVEAGRRWCAEHDVPYTPGTVDPGVGYADGVAMRFRDAMRGHLVPRAAGVAGSTTEVPLEAGLELVIADVGRFVTDPAHPATVTGTLRAPLFGGQARIVDGTAGILVDDGRDPTRLSMRYHLHLVGDDGRPWTVLGLKTVDSGSLRRLWAETTTLHTRVLAGHVDLPDGAAATDGTDRIDDAVIAAGVVRLGLRDVVRQVVTARATGDGLGRRVRGRARFGAMFAGHLWDVYARRALAYGPF